MLCHLYIIITIKYVKWEKNVTGVLVGLIAPPFIIGFLATENVPSLYLAYRNSYRVIIYTNSHESWPKVKLGQVGVRSNIAQNHSSSLLEVIYGHYLLQFICKVDQQWNWVKLESVIFFLRITHSFHMKWCLVFICPNSHKKLSKIEIRKSHYLPLFGFI